MCACLPHFRQETKWQFSTGHSKMFCVAATSAWYPHLGHMARLPPRPASSSWAFICISEYFCHVLGGRARSNCSSRKPELQPLPSQHLSSKLGFLVTLSIPRFPDPNTWLSTYCTMQSLQNRCPFSLQGTHSERATSSKQQEHVTAVPFSNAILLAALLFKRFLIFSSHSRNFRSYWTCSSRRTGSLGNMGVDWRLCRGFWRQHDGGRRCFSSFEILPRRITDRSRW
mmetsp:Transcript_14626/g.36786  ORF Transcript_14626/g.36786 Transcript_14626/m.36786 type:complete len:227 (+) Transcript_14626:576-1256(+)